jgi:hypothetical protein
LVMPPGGEEFDLRLDLEKGRVPDARIAAEALIKWIDAAQAAVRVIDPYCELRIELLGADAGSLNLRAAFRFVEDKVLGPPADFLSEFPRLKKLIVATVIGIPAGLAIVVAEHTMYPELPPEVPPAVQQQYQDLQRKVAHDPTVQTEVRKFYQTVERDTSISGVKIVDPTSKRQLVSVPRVEFPERSGVWLLQEEPQRRRRGAEWDVIVTHPVMLAKPHAWKFVHDGLPFRAKITDPDFLAAIAAGTLPLTIQEGVTMRVRVEWEEELVGQTWVPVEKSRTVTKVIDPNPQR